MTAGVSPVDPINEMGQIISLFRGIALIYRTGWFLTRDPKLLHTVHERAHGAGAAIETPPSEGELSLDRLLEHAVAHVPDEQLRESHTWAVEKLKTTLQKVLANPKAISHLLTWPGTVRPQYAQSLARRTLVSLRTTLPMTTSTRRPVCVSLHGATLIK